MFISVEQVLVSALKKAVGRGVPVVLLKSEDRTYGDYATNVALKLAKDFKRPPIEIAKDIAEKLQKDKEVSKLIEKVEVKPPGFINFFLAPSWLEKQVPVIVSQKNDYGRINALKNKKIQVEFISANPTGPLTLANGRGGFLGDCLANIFEFSGAKVVREYYVNDAGEQIKKLGWSVLKAASYKTPYKDEELYQGGYIKELAEELEVPKPKAQRLNETQMPSSKLAESVARQALKLMLSEIKRSVRKAGIKFDVWFSEKSLYKGGFVDDVLKILKQKRLVREKDGAWWLKLSELKEDRVVVKSSGEFTYILPDIAYHYEKFYRRRFFKVIDILGADHYGHANVLKTSLRALGWPEPDIILLQLVRLVRDGQEVKMSKRAGTFVSLKELLDEVGVDSARWFFLERAPETHMEFDLGLAKERSEKNPVYYVQYAHARCSSMLAKIKDVKPRRDGEKITPLHVSERALLKELVRLPEVVERVVRTYEVRHLPTYATAVATAFSAFYRDCPVLTAEPKVRAFRLQLVRAAKIVLSNTLGIMGISAPEKM